MDSVFNEGFQAMPVGWQLWMYWMMAINTASIVFVKNHVAARAVFVVWILNAGCMMLAAEVVGFTRILGLVHVVFWTPLAIYLYKELNDSEASRAFLIWMRVLLLTIVASLILDYLDVIRYILGDRG
ncbi:MAG: hypothetical protein VCD00_16130 [Candidatus Hydrogenedentota bacterium]